MKEKYFEFHNRNHENKANWLRAAVLGANDGIVSMAGLVLGVAGATTSHPVILTAGVAGLIAGAISMAAGEYVSVSSSKDLQKSLLEKEKYELEHFPEQEMEELAGLYEQKGLSKKTAKLVAQELSAKDPVAAHFDAELKIDPENLTSPWNAAIASCLSFFIGGLIPIIAIIIPTQEFRVPFTFTSVVLSLALAGAISARVGEANMKRGIVRVVGGGIIAMAVTYAIGRAFGVSGII